MAKTFMPEASQEERMSILQNNADKVEETEYEKELTREELDIKNETFVNNHKELSKMEDKLSIVKAEFKANMDPIKTENRVLLRQLSTGKEEVKGIIYHMANHDEGMMETFDHEGELIGSRRLRPDEKRKTLPFIPKAINQ